ALGRAVERQAHVLEVDDRLDGLLGHDLGRVLVDEVFTALDGVEGVPLPVVLLDVREGRAHPALRSTRVGPRGEELRDDGGARTGRGLERGTHPGAPGADDDDVVLVDLHAAPWRGRSGGADRRQQLGGRAGRARVEREDDEGAEHDRDGEGRGQQGLEDDARRVALGIVVDDRAHTVRAMDHREPQHEQVPDLPADVGPLARDAREVDARGPGVDPEVDDQVPEHEHDEHDPRDAHEQPSGHLGVAARRAAVRARGPRGAGHLDRGHHAPPKTLPRWRGRKPAMRITVTATTIHSMTRWWRGPLDQKSTSTTRIPLKAWNTIAATRPASARPMIGFLYAPITAL